MRMTIFDKLLLALLLIALLALSLLVGCVALSVIPLVSITNYLESLIGLWNINAFLFGAIALALFLATVRLLVASYSGDKSQSYTRLSVTENGEIAISIQTIKQIAAAYIAGNPDVIASSSVILPIKDGLVVRVKICVKEGVILPDVTSALQKELKSHLEMVTGLVIREIGVLVDNNRSSYAGKGR